MHNQGTKRYDFPSGAYYLIPFGARRRERDLYYIVPPGANLLDIGLTNPMPYMGQVCRYSVAAHIRQHRGKIKIARHDG